MYAGDAGRLPVLSPLNRTPACTACTAITAPASARPPTAAPKTSAFTVHATGRGRAAFGDAPIPHTVTAATNAAAPAGQPANE